MKIDTDKRFLHVPSKKIYMLNGAGGIIREDGSTNASLPLWLTEDSADFVRVQDWSELEGAGLDTKLTQWEPAFKCEKCDLF